MTKGSFILAAGVLSAWLGCTADAQQIGDRAKARFFGRPIASPAMSLADSRAFPFGSNFAWMAPTNGFLPDWRPVGWDSSGVNLSMGWGQPKQYSGMNGYSKDSSKEVSEVRKSNLLDYVHGEIGGYFGTSTGGRTKLTSEGGYIQAVTGNENLQISVGAFYEHSDAQFQRRGR